MNLTEYLEELSSFYNCSLQKLRIYADKKGIEDIEQYAMSIAEEQAGYYLDNTGGF
jgi:GH18 family chitinase